MKHPGEEHESKDATDNRDPGLVLAYPLFDETFDVGGRKHSGWG